MKLEQKFYHMEKQCYANTGRWLCLVLDNHFLTNSDGLFERSHEWSSKQSIFSRMVRWTQDRWRIVIPPSHEYCKNIRQVNNINTQTDTSYWHLSFFNPHISCPIYKPSPIHNAKLQRTKMQHHKPIIFIPTFPQK